MNTVIAKHEKSRVGMWAGLMCSLILSVAPALGADSFNQAGYFYPTVSTDKPDYLPGDIVTIRGGGWLPCEPIDLRIQSSCAGCPDVTLQAVANENGDFKNAEFEVRDYHLGEHFVLTAKGLLSGTELRHTFTDAVTGISPASKCDGAPDFTLTVSGGGFTASSVVNFNGSPRTTTFINSGELRAAIPAADIVTPGSYPITVTGPGAGGPVTFTVIDGPFVVDPLGGGTHTNIQMAVNSLPEAGPCSITVKVKAGGWNESVGFASKNQAATSNTERIVIQADPAAAIGAVTINPSGLPGSLAERAFLLTQSRFITIRGFDVTGATRHGVILGGGASSCSDIVLDSNLIHDNGSSTADSGGILVGIDNARTWIVNNLVRHNGRNGIGLLANSAGDVPLYLVNNTVFENGFNGIQRSANEEIYLINNLVVGNGTVSGITGGRSGLSQTGSGSATNATLINNIFYKNKLSDIEVPSAVLNASDSGNKTTFGTEGLGIAGCTFPDCTNTHSYNEIFVSATNAPYDLHLRTNSVISPAIDMGTNSFIHRPPAGPEWVPTDDFENDARPQDGDGVAGAVVDVGFDETSTGVDTCSPDVEAPSLSCPIDVTVECDESTAPANTGSATASDNCDASPTIGSSDSVAAGSCPQETVITRAWTAEDDDGNSTSCNQTITVDDSTGPDLTLPSDVTIECDESSAPANTGTATATDNCDIDPDVTPSDSVAAGTCPDNSVITRTWTATDECGNTSSADQTITVVDSTNPDITCPADVTVLCTESTDPADTGSATATDNCDASPLVDNSDSVSPGLITRTWTATDNCGNSSSCVQLITVEDTEAPVITCPIDVTIECDESTDPLNTGEPTATDNCDLSPGFGYSDSVAAGSCAQAGVITRTWTATDDLGNSSSCNQTITVEDTTAPDLTVPADVTIECDESTSPTNTGEATATDCDPAPVVSPSDSVASGSCPANSVITRTWTATDACGNSSSGVQTITVADTTAPVLTLPADVTVECDESTDPIDTGTATATDNCDAAPDVSPSDSVAAGTCAQNSVITRTWTATDECGNTSSADQTITVVDSTAPVLLLPGDVTIECDESTSPANTGTATATDNCDPAPGVNPSDSVAAGTCPDNLIITRTWTATDACGNSSSEAQTITVSDSTNPDITCPADVTVLCSESTDPGDTGSATATDNCDASPSVTPSDSISLGLITRTWTATDACGNSSSCQQLITVEDTEAPVITCPIDVTIECDESTDPLDTGSATATDNCDIDPDINYTDSFTAGSCPQAGVITRTWTATDNVGNSSTCDQSITVEDTTAPDLTVPADVTIECDESSAPANTGTASATDCDPAPVISPSDSVAAGTCSDNSVITRTWTATDDCGNSSSGVQTITVADTTAPVLTLPADVTVECDESTDPIDTGTATATDNCDAAPGVSPSDSVAAGSCANNSIITRTWTATDECGNTSSADQTITVVDTTAPDLLVPGDVTIECDESTSPANTGTATASDNCDPAPGVSPSDSVAAGTCPDNVVITRTWTATDACGNSSSEAQTITVSDTTNPDITCPPDVTVLCTESTDPADTGSATATDNCDPSPSVDPSDSISLGLITRTWTATDACGNSSSCVQLITVQDTEAPVITCPVDVTIECDESTDPLNTGEPTATDNCDVSPDFGYSDSVAAGSCAQNSVITRTWTATDNAGNSSTCDQTITRVDTTAPLITCPADTTVECNTSTAPGATGTATATDNCDGAPIVSPSDSVAAGSCPQNSVITRTWTATDACGNSSQCVQIIDVLDTIPPLVTAPADTTVQCNTSTAPATTGVGSASDNCDPGPAGVPMVWINEFHYDNTGGDVGEFIEVAGTAGINLTNYTLYLYNGANSNFYGTPLVLSGILTNQACGFGTRSFNYPADGIQNGTPDGLALAQGTGLVQFLSYEGPFTATNGPAKGVTSTDVVVTEPGTDPVGRSLQLTDTGTGATYSNAVGSWKWTSPSLQSTGALNVAQTFAVCGAGAIPVTFSDSLAAGSCPQSTVITRTWKALDACGNTGTADQTITVVDTTAPLLTIPADVTIECDESSAPANTGDGTATDNCDPAPGVSPSDSVAAGSCAQNSVITRTWTAADACGNSSSGVQTITVVDTTAPLLTTPADVTIECDESTAPANTGEGTATDNCDPAPVVSPSDSVAAGTCPVTSVITRTWTATDDCGNSSSGVQTITLTDNTAPLLTTPADLTIECDESSSPTNTGEATATDCDPAPSVSPSDSLAAGSCAQNSVITRTWTATDACGNSSSGVQTITVSDTTAPLLTTPADVTIECDESTAPANTGDGTATDNCDPAPGVSPSDSVAAGSCAQNSVITRTWTATDACGNSSSGVQTITVVDTTAPLLTTPADVTIECDESTSPANTGTATATDNCDPAPGVSPSDSVAAGTCPDNVVITRTWTATDACGNSSSEAQTITVSDTTNPDITCPADVTVLCTESTDPADTGSATATDNCDVSPSVTPSDSISLGVITRTWTATDACGNSSSCQQLITVQDTEAPVITCPVDVTIECDESTDPLNTGEPTATDDCDLSPDFGYSDSVGAGTCAQNSVITRTWTATDNAGNSSSCNQTITRVDTTAPLITCPADTTVECNTSTAPGATGTATATDNCDGAPIVSPSDSVAAGSCPQNSVITRTWTATDACGNSSQCVQIIDVLDTIPPLVTAPADTTVQCNTSTAPATTGVGSASDNCDPGPAGVPMVWINEFHYDNTGGDVGEFIEVAGTAGINLTNYTLYLYNGANSNFYGTPLVLSGILTNQACGFGTRSFNYPADGIQNGTPDGLALAQGTGLVQFLSYEGPFTATNGPAKGVTSTDVVVTEPGTDPVGRSLQLTDTGTGATYSNAVGSWKWTSPSLQSTGALNVAQTFAVCGAGAIPVTFSDSIAAGSCPQSTVITRTWTALDACGNTGTADQTITVVDTTAPVLTLPADVTVECDESTDPIDTGTATATDNCDPAPGVSPSDSVAAGTCLDSFVITRTWTATDACGNSSSGNQTITVADTTAPLLTTPGDVTIECDESTAPANTGDGTATDNCDPTPGVSPSDSVTAGSCLDNSVITRTWTATDACGNSSSGVQTITVVDTTAPLLSTPADVTIECDESTAPANTGDGTATDNCDPAPGVSPSDSVAAGSCPQNSVITRTWTATDACGNSSSGVQTITVLDTTAPLLTTPADVTIECDESTAPANTGDGTATDNCDPAPGVSPSDSVAAGSCAQNSVITRTWTATDACGNSSSGVQTITVLDTTAPLLTTPADVTIECDESTAPANTGDGTATDNCDPAPGVSPSDSVAAGSCADNSVITRTWTATDACGNSSSGVQTITVVDSTDPVLTVPADVTLSCTETSDPSDTGTATATDNCDVSVTPTYSDSVSDGVVTRTWTATDDCGNSDSGDQLITLVDEGDTDGDTVLNYEECIAGTSPSDGSEYPVIDAIDLIPSGNEVVFPTKLGRLYTVEYHDDTQDASWIVLATNIPGTGGNVTVTDPGATGKRFYRLQVRLAP